MLCPAGADDVLPSDFARAAEANGFESIWVGEHPAVPVRIERDYVQLVDGHLPYFYTNLADPWMTLAHAAGATSTIRLGTCVGLIPLRHPLLLAKILATLDRHSRGRLVVGAGAGWLIEEMELFGVEFATRFERLEEMVVAMRRIWSEEVVEFHGKHVDFPRSTAATRRCRRRSPSSAASTASGACGWRRAGRTAGSRSRPIPTPSRGA